MNITETAAGPQIGAIDPDQTAKFLEAIAPGERQFTFFTADDNASRDAPELRRTLHGSLAEHAATLAELNRQGAGVFVTVNRTDGSGARKKGNITRIRAVWHDHDTPSVPVPDFPTPPLLTVETSPNKFHSYWPIAEGPTLSQDEHRAVEDVLVTQFGSDKHCKDIARVMRLPGFWHVKGKPHFVTIKINMAPFVGGYSPDDIRKAFIPAGIPPRPALPSVSAGTADPERIRSALAKIDATDRDTWLSVGMALHYETGGSQEGFELWDDWAQTCPEKYSEEGQDKAWRHFRPDGVKPVTLGTIFHLAQQSGWVDPNLTSEFSAIPEALVATPVAPALALASRFVPLGISLEDAKLLPQRPWLVPNMLERGELSMLVAPGAAGKSLWALHVGAAVALGGISREGGNPLGVNVRERGRVLFLGYEDRLNDLHRRTTAFCLQHGVDPAMLRANLTGFDVSKGRVLIAERDGRNGRRIGPGYRELVDAIKGGGYDFIVADPLVKFHSLNENDNGEMNFACDLLRDMALETKAAVLTTHHTGKLKDGPESIAGDADAGRGASALRDAVRILLTISMLDAKTAGQNNIPEGERWRYFRVDDGKINHGPRSGGPSWFCKASITIPNGESAPAIVPVSFGASPEAIRLQHDIFNFILKRGPEGVPASERGNKNLGTLVGKETGIEKAQIEAAADCLKRNQYIVRGPRSDRDQTEVWRVAPGQEKWAGEVEVR